ncbi:hypothetical protein [Nonomuraea sp. JJY05]|uniref:hypothetical protein n=1 Tax=Nonomuraea sp. JJY05 TaxID=3350255 RepID=UPI00373F7486
MTLRITLAALSLAVLGTTAATADSESSAACPAPGQRFKSPTSPAIFLVDPDNRARWIPNETVYFSLWETYDGIVILNDFSACFGSFTNLNGAHLVKSASSPQVFIWDSRYGAYRWIINEAVFNKYAFSWRKVRVQSATVSPVTTERWDF